MKKIKAFSILEITLVMMVFSILVILSYNAIAIFNKNVNKESNTFQSEELWNTWKKNNIILEERSDFIEIKSDMVSYYINDSLISTTIFVGDRVVTRTNDISDTLSFRIKNIQTIKFKNELIALDVCVFIENKSKCALIENRNTKVK